MTRRSRRSPRPRLGEPPRLAPILNQLIDSTLHPLAEEKKEVWFLDAALHHAVEAADTLVQSWAKTARYTVPRLVGEGEATPRRRRKR